MVFKFESFQSSHKSHTEELLELDPDAPEELEGRGSLTRMLAESKSSSIFISQSLSNPLSDDENEVRLSLFVDRAAPMGLVFLRFTSDDEVDASVVKPELSPPESLLNAVGTACRMVSMLLERLRLPGQSFDFFSSM